jgi:hypothetical protein
MPTRRQFLLSCSALAAATTAAPAIALGAPFRSGEIALDQISFLDFAGMVNTTFRVIADSRAVELCLIGIKSAAPSAFTFVNAGDAGNEKFSFQFSGPTGEPLRQDTHHFEHQLIGRFQMFIVPVGPREPGLRYYEAVFNRPVPGGRAVRGLAGRSVPTDTARDIQPDAPKTSSNI